MRKIFALLLALVMTFGLATTASAADNGSITIAPAVEGYTYSIYKIFDLESYNEDTGAYSYTIDSSSPWFSFMTTGEGASYVTVDTADRNYVTWKDGVDDNDATVAAFAKAALAYAKANNSITATASKAPATDAATVEFTSLDLGYYLVDSTMGALCGLTTTQPDATVREKNTEPTIKKEVEEDSNSSWGETNDADIDQVVNFKTTVSAKAGAENYVVHDKMSAGLTLNQDSIAITGLTKGTDYTVAFGTVDGCTFEIVFAKAYLDTITADTDIIITYSATLNETAVIGGAGNPNETKLTYGDENTTEWDKTITYTWDMKVIKYTTKESEEVTLAGATFQLKDKNGNALTFTDVTIEDGVPTYKVDKDGTVTQITTDENGTFIIIGLDADTYALEETKAPDGYNILDEDIEIKIEATDGTDSNGQKILTYNTVEEKVENKTGTILPTTGGIGTTIFYGLGGILVLVAVVLLITKKRMGSEA